MPTLRSLCFKTTYDPSADGSDVLNEFYIPCLKNSAKYDRMSAYFSSSVLKLFGEGLHEFVKNNGKIRFIFSCEIPQEEMDIITTAYKEKMDELSDSITDLDDDFNFANLSHLIKTGIADVKIAFMLKGKTALAHTKQGLFTDEEGNRVYFDGSGNETENGILNNAELFSVHTAKCGEKEKYIEDGVARFEAIWNNTYNPYTIRTEVPVGRLFDVLVSCDKNRIFNSAKEYYEYRDCVLIDIDKEKNCFILTDFTSRKILSMPMVLKSKLSSRWDVEAKDTYSVFNIDLGTLKEVIVKNLKKFNVEYVYTNGLKMYVEQNDLLIDKRIKLGSSIKHGENKELWQKDFNKFKYIVDSETKLPLKDKQMINAYFHYAMKSSFDFSVPGTGKTFISYGMFAYLRSTMGKEREVESLVVFGPLNCFKAWKDESKKIFGQQLNTFNINDHHGDYEQILKNNKFELYLFNYDFINSDFMKAVDEWVLSDKTMVVFDEIHKLKSEKGVRATTYKELFKYCKNKPIYKLALTGTPIPNSYADMYNYFQLLFSDDSNGFFSDINLPRLKSIEPDTANEAKLIGELDPVFMRTTKKDLSVPPANADCYIMAECTDEEEELLYLVSKTYKNPLVKFIRMMQATTNPSLLNKVLDKADMEGIWEDDNCSGDLSEFVYSDDIRELVNKITITSKTQATLEGIEKVVHRGNKVIVWCLFIDTIDLISKELQKKGITNITICGRDSVPEREDKIEIFKNDLNVKVLITNPNTLAESVSLHQVCHNAFYLEYGFNLTYLLQSKDRIHRVGLPDGTETNYYFALAETKKMESIDKHVYEILDKKAERMKRIIESNSVGIEFSASDINDIKDLMKRYYD